MFKLVVLCAIIAGAAAEPALLASPLAYSTAPIAAPLAYSGTFAAPASYISPSYVQPTVYSTPYGYSHFIKKRSVFAPTTYLPSSPWATTYSTHIVPSAPVYPVSPIAPVAPLAYSTATHFIKKRSAPIAALPASYIAPVPYTAATPYVSYSAPLHTFPYISSPLSYPTHFIKKRSLPIAYAAPAAVSHQSRVDYSGPVVSSYAAVSPFGYAAPSPLAYSAAGPISYASSFATPVAL